MSLLLAILTFVVAAAAAARSTWSPCGRSMLSTITPIGERGRLGRYGSTATFFVLGAVLGGAVLGLAAAALAVAVAALGLPVLATGMTAAAAAFVVAASDARVVGFELPIHRRQVNERWLDTFRPWFYGFGFGFQIGSGFATYITTAALYLLVALAALSGSPAVALGAGIFFGLVRGSSVLLARCVTSPEALRALHHRLGRLDPAASGLVVVVDVAAGLALLIVSWWPAVPVAAVAVLVVAAVVTLARRTPAPSPN
jgi:hypothetical protein